MKGYWIVIAVLLIIIGITVFAAVMTANKWDFSILSTDKIETASHIIDSDFRNISVNTDTADITFLKSEDGTCKVVCSEYSKRKYTVVVEEQSLKIAVKDERAWYDHIELFSVKPGITIYLPNTKYEALSVSESTGNVEITSGFSFENIDISTTTGNIITANLTTGTLSLSVSTGKIEANAVDCAGDIEIGVSTGKAWLEDVKCKNFNSKGTTGDLVMKNLIAKETIAVKRNTGDISFDGCDANEINVKTTTGKVTGSLLSEKTFFAKTDTGRVSVPKTTSGGKCEINTDTGNIKIEIKN